MFLDAYLFNIFISDTKITLFNIFTLVVAGVALRLYYQRNKTDALQTRQKLKLEQEQNIYDRFAVAINALNAQEMATRTGAIYLLFHLAKKYPIYISEIVQIFTTHIRSKTQEESYQKYYQKQPSNEVQICIDLLFKNNGLHTQKDNSATLNLGYSYLVGANFNQAYCVNVIFDYANLTLASFQSANCQNALFYFANLSEADFEEAQCQKTTFIGIKAQDVLFNNASCQGASFQSAQCQNAYFNNTDIQGANFQNAFCQFVDWTDCKCQGANFQKAQCQGANFSYAICQATDFQNSNLQGANLTNAQCQDAIFNNTLAQGSFADEDNFEGFELSERIDENTDLDWVVFQGPLNIDSINSIENSKHFLEEYWYALMLDIIKRHNSLEKKWTPPKGLIKGKLKETAELKAIIKNDWLTFKELHKK
jgi:uncharacterized protein YjbI with pentapeptide repeats